MVAKKGSSEKTRSFLLTLSVELFDRVEAHRARMGATVPGATFSRHDAVRSLLLAGLDNAERAARPH
jgi:hypothetical protein